MKNKDLKNIRGATMTEYVLLIGLIAAAAVMGLTSVGNSLTSFFDDLSKTISSATKAIK